MRRMVTTTRWHAALVALAVLTTVTAGKARATGGLGDDPSTFDQQMDTAYLKRDVAFIAAVAADDMRFTHNDGTSWNKEEFLDAARTYNALAPDVDDVKGEKDGDVVQTTGHLHVKPANPQQNLESHIYFVRLYAHRATGWQFLSHRTMRSLRGALSSQ